MSFLPPRPMAGRTETPLGVRRAVSSLSRHCAPRKVVPSSSASSSHSRTGRRRESDKTDVCCTLKSRYSDVIHKYRSLQKAPVLQNTHSLSSNFAPVHWKKSRNNIFRHDPLQEEDIEAMYDVSWFELVSKIQRRETLWSASRTRGISEDEFDDYQNKVALLRCDGVTEALNQLNTVQGHEGCPEGKCLVWSNTRKIYYILFRDDVEATTPEGWRSVRKKYFPGGLLKAEEVEAMYSKCWMELRNRVSEGVPLWSVYRSMPCASVGQEHVFQRKAELLQHESCSGVRGAVDFLNTVEGHVACPEGYCVVFSETLGNYFFLCRSDKDITLDELSEILDLEASHIIQAAAMIGKWQGIRKTYFPDSALDAAEVEALYSQNWLDLRQKILNGVALWTMDGALPYACAGEEHVFQGKKVEVLKHRSCVGVREAIDRLNTLEGHVACPEGYCVVFSERLSAYFFLCRSDIDKDVITLEYLSEGSQLTASRIVQAEKNARGRKSKLIGHSAKPCAVELHNLLDVDNIAKKEGSQSGSAASTPTQTPCSTPCFPSSAAVSETSTPVSSMAMGIELPASPVKDSATPESSSSEGSEAVPHEASIPEMTLLQAGLELRQELGHGNQSSVHLAFAKTKGVLSCIKRFRKSASTPSSLEFMRDEYRVMQEVGMHPSIAQALRIFQDTTSFYIELPLYTGGDFRTLKRNALESGACSNDRWWDGIVGQILQGLSHLHGYGFVHCDVKESNLMLKTDNYHEPEAVLIDFGVVQALDAKRTAVFGTPGYIAPEVWDTKLWTPRADAFSLGVVILQIMLDRVPDSHRPRCGIFTENTQTFKDIKAATQTREPDLSGIRASFGKRLRQLTELTEKLLVKDPSKRPSAIEASAILESGLEQSFEISSASEKLVFQF